MRVYIAGPYTKGDVALNVRAAIEAGNRVAEAGHFPFIPHFSHFWHMQHPHDWRFWMDQDKAWLSVCDALIRLPGDSTGAEEETAEMLAASKPVFYSVEEWLGTL